MKQKWWQVISGASINEANVWNKKKQEKGKTPVPASGAFVLCERQTERRPGYRSTDFPSATREASLHRAVAPEVSLPLTHTPVTGDGLQKSNIKALYSGLKPNGVVHCCRPYTKDYKNQTAWSTAANAIPKIIKTKRRGPLLPTLYQRL